LAGKHGILVQSVDGQFYDAAGTLSNGLYIHFYDKKATDDDGKNDIPYYYENLFKDDTISGLFKTFINCGAFNDVILINKKLSFFDKAVYLAHELGHRHGMRKHNKPRYSSDAEYHKNVELRAWRGAALLIRLYGERIKD
jgi:hypothetical protein